MTLRRVRFMAAARRELRRAVDWYDREAPGLGDELVAEIDHALQEVVEYPDAGSPHLADTRRLLTQRFPYSIIYQARGEEIVVIAVAHQRRRPSGFTVSEDSQSERKHD